MDITFIYEISAAVLFTFILCYITYYRYRVKIFRKLAYFDIKREDVLHIKEHFPFYDSLSPLLREFYFLEIGALLKTIELIDNSNKEVSRSRKLLLCASIAKLTYGMKINRIHIPIKWELSKDTIYNSEGQKVTWEWLNQETVMFSKQVFKDEIETRTIENGLLLDIIIDVLFKEDQEKNIFHFHRFISTADIVKAKKVLRWITNPRTDQFEKKCFRKYFKDPDALRNNYPELYKELDSTFSSEIAI
jgi:hypothetical protein